MYMGTLTSASRVWRRRPRRWRCWRVRSAGRWGRRAWSRCTARRCARWWGSPAARRRGTPAARRSAWAGCGCTRGASAPTQQHSTGKVLAIVQSGQRPLKLAVLTFDKWRIELSYLYFINIMNAKDGWMQVYSTDLIEVHKCNTVCKNTQVNNYVFVLCRGYGVAGDR